MRAPVELAGEVHASALAEQVYCEYRVHLSLTRPRSPPRPSPAARVVERVLGVPRATFRATVAGVPLAARPHAVYRAGGSWVVLRARVSGSLRWRPSDRVYLEAAALAAGIEEGLLVLALAVDERALAEALARARADPRPARGKGWTLVVWVYEREDALRELEPLLAYWRGERPPRPRPSPGRCGACEYSSECPFSASSDHAAGEPVEEPGVYEGGQGEPGSHVNDHRRPGGRGA